MTSEKPAGTSSRMTLSGLLSFFTEVRSGEAVQALLMTLSIFLILTSYLIAKVVREPLILAGGGAELKSYASAVQVILLLIIIRMYTACVQKYPRQKLMQIVNLLFVLSLVAFWLSLQFFGPWNGIVFYFWVGIFSLMVIAQFWSFANDIYTPEQGQRLFVLLAFGASAGGVFGPMLAGLMLDLVGLYNLLLVSAVVLLASMLISNYVSSRNKNPNLSHYIKPERPPTECVEGKTGALKIVFRSRYLLMIAMLVLLTNWVNSTGEYILGRSISESAAEKFAGSADSIEAEQAFIGSFYANFFSIVGFVGLLLQLLVVSRVVKYLGVRFALMTLPVIALGGYMAIAIVPILGLISFAKTAENSTDYSLNNTVRQILFLPTSREEKYKAKVAIDTFFVRFGDVLAAGLVFVGVQLLSFEVRQFSLVAMALVLVWLILAFFIGKENRKLVKECEECASE